MYIIVLPAVLPAQTCTKMKENIIEIAATMRRKSPVEVNTSFVDIELSQRKKKYKTETIYTIYEVPCS
jgi:hypothetical protein